MIKIGYLYSAIWLPVGDGVRDVEHIVEAVAERGWKQVVTVLASGIPKCQEHGQRRAEHE